MADRVYTKEDLDKYLKAQENALNGVDNSNNFENIHLLAVEDLKAFVSGSVDITPDSFDAMRSFIETFAGGYKSDDMKKLYTEAMIKLNQKQDQAKRKILEETLEEVKQERKDDKQKEKNLDDIARRIRILLVPDENNKAGRLDSLQKELSVLSGNELSIVAEKVEKLNPTNTQKTKFQEQVVINLQGKYLVRNPDGSYTVKNDVIETVLPEDRKGYLKVLDQIKEKSYDKKRVDPLYNAFTTSQNEKIKEQIKRGEQKETVVANKIDRKDQEIRDEKPNEKIQLNGDRVRQADNLDNDIALALLKLEVLHDEGKISDAEFAKSTQTFENLAVLRETAGLSMKDEANFALVSKQDEIDAYNLLEPYDEEFTKEPYLSKWIEKLVLKLRQQPTDRFDQLVTPEVVTKVIDSYQKKADNKKLSQQERQDAENILKDYVARGNSLISDLKNKQGYYYTDYTNTADEYDGYTHLIEKLKSDKNYRDPNINYDDAQKLMDQYVKPYDTLYSIPSKNAAFGTVDRMTSRLRDAIPVIDKLEFNVQNLGQPFMDAISNFKFATSYDQNGNPINFEQCIQNGAVVKGSSLDTLLRYASNDVLMQNLNSKNKLDEKFILNKLQDVTFATMFSYANAEETIKKGLREDPTKFTDPKKVDAFKKSLEQNKATVLSPLAVNLALKRQAHNVETYTNRLTTQLGPENTQYFKAALEAQIKEIDQTSHYEDHTRDLKRRSVRRGLIGAGLSAGLAAGASYTATVFAAKLNLGAPNVAICALSGAAIGGLAYFVSKKISAKINHQKYGWQEFKKDIKTPQFASAVISGTLGGASIGCALSGNPIAAVNFGYAAMGTAAIGRFIASYRDMRRSGHKKVWSFAMASINAVAVPVGGAVGRQLGLLHQQPQTHLEVANKDQVEYLQNNPKARGDWKPEYSRTPGEDFYPVGYDNNGMPIYNKTDVLSAQGRVESWFNKGPGAEILQSFKHSAMQQGITEDMFWIKANQSIISNPKGIPASLGSNNAYAGPAQTGTDFATPSPVQVTHSNNHMLWGTGALKAAEQVGIVPQDVKNAADFLNFETGTVNANSEIIASLNKIDKVFTPDGAIMSVKGTPHLNQVLPNNASYNPNTGTLEEGGDTFSSYHGGAIETTHETLFAKFTRLVELPKISAMFAPVIEGVRKIKKKIRPGTRGDEIIPDGDNHPKRPYVKPEVTITNIEHPKPPYVKPEVTIAEDPTIKLMIDEYKIVYGIEPSDSSYDSYYARVEKERMKEAPNSSMYDYLVKRREQLDEFVATKLSAVRENQIGELFDPVKVKADYMSRKITDKRPQAIVISESRQSLMESNLTKDNFKNVITLTHFKKYLDHYIVQDVMVADGTRDFSKNPTFKTSGDRIEIYDLNAYLVEGKTKGESNIEGADGKSIPLSDIKLLRQRTSEEIKEGIHPKLDLEAVKNRAGRLAKLTKEQTRRTLKKQSGRSK